MKIRLWSDLHLEFREYLYDHIFDPIWAEPGANKDQILVLAGDIGCGILARHFVTKMCEHFKYVILICGNHEFYHHDFDNVIAGWRSFAGDGDNILVEKGPDNFYFLNNNTVVLDDVRFIGGTMWTSMADGDPFVMGAAHRQMSDYVEIRSKGERITPHFVMREHDIFLDFLLREFDKPFDGKTIVITHYSPGNEVRRSGRKRDLLDSAYFADMEQLIGWHNKVHLWLHGHTHQTYDYIINETRVVSNPYGYWGHSTNPNFDSNLIIEI